MKKIAFIALAAALTSLGATADTIVTSKTYVDTTRQAKITPADTGTLATYNGQDTNGGAVFSSTAVHSANTYTAGTDANKIPTMGAVMAQINRIAGLPSGANGNALRHNGTSWVAQAVYSDASSYTAGTDADKLVTASALNTVKTAVDTLQNCKHTCASSDPNNSNLCDLITINCVEPASQN